jgi:tetratricopeptide (TPR) repeat protein
VRLPKYFSHFVLSLAAPGCLSIHRAEKFLQEKQPEKAQEVLEGRWLHLHERETALLEAEAALQIGDGKRAKQEAQHALRLELSQTEDPKASTQTLLLCAEAEILLGDVLAAMPYIDEALSQNAVPSRRLVGRLLRVAPKQARTLLEKDEPDSALRILGLVLSLAPTGIPLTLYAQALYARAQDREITGDSKAALEDYVLAAPMLPTDEESEAWSAAGNIYLQEKNIKEAENAFQQSVAALELDQDIIEQTEYIAKRYEDWGEAAYAARLYEELANKKSTPHYFKKAAELFVQAKLLEEGERVFQLYAETQSDKAQANGDFASFFKKRGDLSSWEKYARLAIEANPKRFKERQAICDVWAEQGRLDKVKLEFDSYIDALKQSGWSLIGPYTEIAGWYVNKKQDDAALVAFENAKKAGAAPGWSLADAYGKLKRFTEMKATLDAIIAASTNKRNDRIWAARKLYGVGEYALAIPLVQEVFAKDNPIKSDAALLLADLFYGQGDTAAEEKILSTYAAAMTDLGAAWRDVANRYLKRGDKQHAERAFINGAGKGDRRSLLDLGDLYLTIGDKTKAREAFQRYVDTAPDAYYALSEILSHYPTTDSEEKTRILEEQTKLKTKDAGPFLKLATEYLKSGNPTAAATAFEGYVRANIDQASAYKIIGEQYSNFGYLELAQEAFEKAIDSYPDSAEGLFNKGRLSLDLSLGSSALSYFEQYRGHEERTPQRLYEIAALLHKKNRYAAALPFYEASLALDPNQNNAQKEYGKCALSNGDLDKASAAFSKLPKDPSSFLEIGSSYRAAGYDALAIPYLQEAFLQKTDNLDTIFEPSELAELALALRDTGKGDLLPDIAKKLLDLCPANGGCYGLHLGLASAYLTLDRPKLRLYHLEQANRARPGTGNSSILYVKIAETLISLGESRRAQDYYLKAANLTTDPGQHLYNSADTLQKKGELGLARELYLLSTSFHSKSENDAKVNASIALYLLGDQQKASKELTQFAKSDNTPEAWEKIARAFLRCKELTKAAEAFEESIHLKASPGSLSLELAKLQFSLGDTQEALKTLRDYLYENPAAREQIEIAKILSESGFTVEAFQIYQQLILKSEPSDAIEAFQRGSTLLISQQDKEALQKFVATFLAGGSAEKSKALLESGKALTQLGLNEEATQLLRQVFEQRCTETVVFDTIKELLKLGLNEEALSQFRRFAYQQTNPMLVLYRAADSTSGDLALTLFEEALSLSPLPQIKAEILEKKARLLLSQNQATEAATTFIEAITSSTSPSNRAQEAMKNFCEQGACSMASSFLRFVEEPAAQTLWKATIQANQQKDPSALLDEFIQKSPPKKSTQDAAKIALESGQLELVSRLFQKNPPPAMTNVSLNYWVDATLLQEQYNLTNVTEQTLQNTSNFSDKVVFLQSLLTRGEAEAVLPLARSLRQERPWDQKALQVLLTSLVAVAPNGWEKEAISCAEQYGVSRTYEEDRALSFAADLLFELGAFSPAGTLYEKAIPYNNQNSQIYLSLGKIKLIQGELSAAKEQFSKAIAVSASPELLWVQIGDLYQATESIELALGAYQQANNNGNETQALWEKIAEAKLLSNDLEGAQEALSHATQESASPEQAVSLFALRLLVENGTELVEPLSSLVNMSPPSPEIKTVQMTLRALGGDEKSFIIEEVSPTLQKSIREVFRQNAPNSKLLKQLNKNEEPPQTLYRAFWTPRASLWSGIFSRYQMSTTDEELAVLWNKTLCGSPRACPAVISSTPSSQLLAITMAETAEENGQKRLAKLALHLSPVLGEGAYPSLITSALQAGDKTTAAQLANEWRRSAVASGADVRRSLLAVAITQTSPDPNTLRYILFDTSPELLRVTRKLLSDGTLPLSW